MSLESILDALRMLRVGFNFLHGRSYTRHQDDEVVPIEVLDNNFMFRTQFLRGTFCFNSVLNPQILFDCASDLITTHGYRRLGARLRLVRTSTLLQFTKILL